MNDITPYIKKAADDIRLSATEKTRMSNVVQSYMRFNALPKPVTTYTRTVDWLVYLHRPVATALVLVLISGTGVSFAAESSLPGDALYAVKKNITEPVRVALATGAEAKANVQIDLAERRIEEAATLSSEGRLDEATQDELAASFETHAASAAAEVEKIDEDSSARVELASRFETRLAAHEAVLATIQESNEKKSLSRAIRTAGLAVADIRTRAEERASVSSPIVAASFATTMDAVPRAETMSLKTAGESAPAATSKTDEVKYDARAAERMRGAAEKQLKATNKKMKLLSSRLESSYKMGVQAELKHAQDLIASGRVLMNDKATAHAFHAFQESLVISERLNVMLNASTALKKASVRSANATNSDTHDSSSETNAKTDTKEDARVEASLNATIPLQVNIEAAETHTEVIPPSIQIFAPREENDDKDRDGDTEDKKGSGEHSDDLKLDISL